MTHNNLHPNLLTQPNQQAKNIHISYNYQVAIK